MSIGVTLLDLYEPNAVVTDTGHVTANSIMPGVNAYLDKFDAAIRTLPTQGPMYSFPSFVLFFSSLAPTRAFSASARCAYLFSVLCSLLWHKKEEIYKKTL